MLRDSSGARSSPDPMSSISASKRAIEFIGIGTEVGLDGAVEKNRSRMVSRRAGTAPAVGEVARVGFRNAACIL